MNIGIDIDNTITEVQDNIEYDNIIVNARKKGTILGL